MPFPTDPGDGDTYYNAHGLIWRFNASTNTWESYTGDAERGYTIDRWQGVSSNVVLNGSLTIDVVGGEDKSLEEEFFARQTQ